MHRREIKCLLLKFLHLKLMQTSIMLRGKVKILLDLAQYLDRNNKDWPLFVTWNLLPALCNGSWINVQVGVSSSTDQSVDEEFKSESFTSSFKDLLKYSPSLLNQNRMHLTWIESMNGLISFLYNSLLLWRNKYFSVKYKAKEEDAVKRRYQK